MKNFFKSLQKSKFFLLSLIAVLFISFCFTNTAQAATVKLNKTSISIFKGATYQLKVTGTKSKITWSTTNSKIATVTSAGKVTGKTKGSCTVKAKVSGKTYSCKVTIKQPVTKITLNKTSITLTKGKTYTLKQTVAPSNANTKSVTWTSSNTKIATVSSKGVITAKSKGTATITCTAKDGSKKKATCKITVNNPVAATVYITDTGKKYHKAGCRYLDESKHAISLTNAKAQGYTACSVCY